MQFYFRHLKIFISPSVDFCWIYVYSLIIFQCLYLFAKILSEFSSFVLYQNEIDLFLVEILSRRENFQLNVRSSFVFLELGITRNFCVCRFVESLHIQYVRWHRGWSDSPQVGSLNAAVGRRF